MQHAGVVHQQVDARVVVEHQREFACERIARSFVRDIQRQHVQAPGMVAGQRVERGSLAGPAAGGEHVVAARQQLADELQAEAAVGAGDEGGAQGHGRSLARRA